MRQNELEFFFGFPVTIKGNSASKYNSLQLYALVKGLYSQIPIFQIPYSDCLNFLNSTP